MHTVCLIGSCYRLSEKAFDCLNFWVSLCLLCLVVTRLHL